MTIEAYKIQDGHRDEVERVMGRHFLRADTVRYIKDGQTVFHFEHYHARTAEAASSLRGYAQHLTKIHAYTSDYSRASLVYLGMRGTLPKRPAVAVVLGLRIPMSTEQAIITSRDLKAPLSLLDRLASARQ